MTRILITRAQNFFKNTLRLQGDLVTLVVDECENFIVGWWNCKYKAATRFALKELHLSKEKPAVEKCQGKFKHRDFKKVYNMTDAMFASFSTLVLQHLMGEKPNVGGKAKTKRTIAQDRSLRNEDGKDEQVAASDTESI